MHLLVHDLFVHDIQLARPALHHQWRGFQRLTTDLALLLPRGRTQALRSDHGLEGAAKQLAGRHQPREVDLDGPWQGTLVRADDELLPGLQRHFFPTQRSERHHHLPFQRHDSNGAPRIIKNLRRAAHLEAVARSLHADTAAEQSRLRGHQQCARFQLHRVFTRDLHTSGRARAKQPAFERHLGPAFRRGAEGAARSQRGIRLGRGLAQHQLHHRFRRMAGGTEQSNKNQQVTMHGLQKLSCTPTNTPAITFR